MLNEINDPTPHTPFLRSDCDGKCETQSFSSRLRSGNGHGHGHSHNHKQQEPSTSSTFFKTPALPPSDIRGQRVQTDQNSVRTMLGMTSTTRQRKSSTSSHSSHSSRISAKDFEKIKKSIDLDDPARTDYTYSYSSTYMNKPPTPDWMNPKMSRRALHGTSFFRRSKTGRSIWDWISYNILRKRKQVEVPNEILEESSDEEVPQNTRVVPNGRLIGETPLAAPAGNDLEDSSPRKHQFGFITSSASSVFWSLSYVVLWVFSTISYTLFWPAQKVRDAVLSTRSQEKLIENWTGNSAETSMETSVETTMLNNSSNSHLETWEGEDFTDDWITTRNRERKSGCCGPLFCWLFIPLLLLLLGAAAWRNEDSKQIIRLYIFPFPMKIFTNSRQQISHYFYSDASSNGQLNTITAVESEVTKAEFLKLKQAVLDLEKRLNGVAGKCCKDLDLSVFLRKTDFDLMLDENGDIRKLRFDVLHTKEEMKKLSGEFESSVKQNSKEISKLKKDVLEIQALIGGLVAKCEANTVASEVVEGLGKISSLVSRLAALEVLVANLERSAGKAEATEAKSRADKEELTLLISEQRNSLESAWMAEVKGLIEAFKNQENRIGELSVSQQSLSVKIEEGIRTEMAMRDVKGLIAAAIARYDMDKTGMADHALEPAGGSVLSVRCSETYSPRTRKESILGFPIWYSNYSPRTVIQPGVVPGECWAFKGAKGFLVIQLSGWINISSFAYEHIPRVMSPEGRIESAPKDFEVWGLHSENDPNGVLLGRYIYDQNGEPLQHFPIQAKETEAIPVIELKILSNHGNPVYTCLYRFRVHGKRFRPDYGVE